MYESFVNYQTRSHSALDRRPPVIIHRDDAECQLRFRHSANCNAESLCRKIVVNGEPGGVGKKSARCGERSRRSGIRPRQNRRGCRARTGFQSRPTDDEWQEEDRRGGEGYAAWFCAFLDYFESLAWCGADAKVAAEASAMPQVARNGSAGSTAKFSGSSVSELRGLPHGIGHSAHRHEPLLSRLRLICWPPGLRVEEEKAAMVRTGWRVWCQAARCAGQITPNWR